MPYRMLRSPAEAMRGAAEKPKICDGALDVAPDAIAGGPSAWVAWSGDEDLLRTRVGALAGEAGLLLLEASPAPGRCGVVRLAFTMAPGAVVDERAEKRFLDRLECIAPIVRIDRG